MVGYKHTGRQSYMNESRKYGDFDNKSQWADHSSPEVVDKEKYKWESVGVLTKNNGGVDKRSSAVKRGEVVVDKFGRATGLAEKAREIMENDRDGQYGYTVTTLTIWLTCLVRLVSIS